MTDDAPEVATIGACVQFDVRRGDVEHNVARMTEGLQAAAQGGARLVVLPEMWTTSFTPTVTPELVAASRAAEQRMIELSATLGLVVVGGGLAEHDGKHFNHALIVDAGRVLGDYRKIHLFTPNAEHRVLAAGDEPVIADTSVGRIGVLLCYDIRFPELVRWHFYRKAEILAVPAQWPEARAAHWRALLTARAIENQAWVLGCNRFGVEASMRQNENLLFPGDSRIIDPMGEIVATGAGEDSLILAELELRRVRTMRRILPVARDRRPALYLKWWMPGFRNG